MEDYVGRLKPVSRVTSQVAFHPEVANASTGLRLWVSIEFVLQRDTIGISEKSSAQKLPRPNFPIVTVKNHHYRIRNSGWLVFSDVLKSSTIAPAHARRPSGMAMPIPKVAVLSPRSLILLRDSIILESWIWSKTCPRALCIWSSVYDGGHNNISRNRNISHENAAGLQRGPFRRFDSHFGKQLFRQPQGHVLCDWGS